MSIVVTVMNMKGGVGKTTVALHLAAGSALQVINEKPNPKILVIDYDPQFNLSQSCLKADKYFSVEKNNKTIHSVLVESIDSIDPFIIQTPSTTTPPSVSDIAINILNWRNKGSLDLVPSSMDMMYIALGQLNDNQNKIEIRFEKFISECKKIYDLIYIDCHPAGSLLTRTALQNSDHVLIPVTPHGYAARGIGLMFKFIDSTISKNKKPTPHILFNMTTKNNNCPMQNEIRTNPRFMKYCLTKTMKKYRVYSDVQNTNFIWYSKKAYSNQAIENMQEISKEFISRITKK